MSRFDDEFGCDPGLSGGDLMAFGGGGMNVAAAVGSLEAECLATLHDQFGYDEFRDGQWDAINAVLSGRDAAVFWATGHGKSLCYQLPALHTGRTVVVISPLISLMHDQCIKMNATVGQGHRRLAVALTSADNDPRAVEDVFAGEVPLVYCSPERIMTSGFLERLARLKQSHGIALFAIDESHCICQWGFDFRKEYQMLSAIREHRILRGVPLMALTATANSAQRREIAANLGMVNPTVCLGTFDRPNLSISVSEKGSSYSGLSGLIETLKRKPESTIVYVPTRRESDDITGYLSGQLLDTGSSATIAGYHAGMTPNERQRVHVGFLNGSITCVVATVAFAMGIDKPDIRHVLHFGVPKGFEEYYQQVGRAGRDGLPARCTMLYTEADFTRYQSDFYMGALPPQAKQVLQASLGALQRYSRSATGCRRAFILTYFEETPSFSHCGQCDNCMRRSKDGGEVEMRDFGPDARVILNVLAAVSGAVPMTTLMDLIGGKYKPKFGGMPYGYQQAMDTAQRAKAALNGRRSDAFFKSLVIPLVEMGLIEQNQSSVKTASGYNNVYNVHSITAGGSQVVRDPLRPVMMPLPAAIREQEEAQRQARAKIDTELLEAGIDITQVATADRDNLCGPTLDPHLHFLRQQNRYRQSGRGDLADANDLLLARVFAWREAIARELCMAPASVLSDHLAKKICYSKVDSTEALLSMGVRIAKTNELAAVVRNWVAEFNPRRYPADGRSDAAENVDPVMVLPESFTPPTKFPHEVYKLRTKANLDPVWEVYYKDFQEGGRHAQAIACSPPYGSKSVQVNTVLGHLLTALRHGRRVSLKRMVDECNIPPIRRSSWDAIASGMIAANVDLSRPDDFEQLKGVIPAIFAKLGIEIPTEEEDRRAAEHQALIANWYDSIKLYKTFVRAQVPIVWSSTAVDGPPSKRQCI